MRKEVRETGELRRLPVVMLTSSKKAQDVVRSCQLGVNAYVLKPVECRDFMKAIADLSMFRGGAERAAAGLESLIFASRMVQVRMSTSAEWLIKWR